jgi:DNA modification methylase
VIRIIQGDAREMLATLPDTSVQCVVTSPPYYGLRDYGTAQWDGGMEGCDHRAGSDYGTKNDTNCGAIRGGPFRSVCGKCGARRIDAQIGLEATPDEYIAQMVAVFREVRRVLRPDGTLFLNLGDSYAAHPSGHITGSDGRIRPGVHDPNTTYDDRTFTNKPFSTVGNGYKPKDLMMMPARVALALQADGWWLRSDIIWHKPNPMPESVTDRPTSAHEHVFLLAKSARYYFDADTVRERAGEETRRNTEFRGESTPYKDHQSFNNLQQIKNYAPAGEPSLEGRNCRNVWTIATSPFSEAHFATFPPELAERCIKAGTSERGCCAACGAPWGRVVERESASFRPTPYDAARPDGMTLRGTQFTGAASTTTGWAPTCKCDAAVVPCTILDPFAGAFTTALVADRLQRHAIGIELSPEYCAMARRRLEADAGMFAEVEAA